MTGSIEILIGAILPFFIDFINRYVKESKHRYYIALGISLLIGLATSFNEITGLDYTSAYAVLTAGGIIFTSAQTSYKLYWEESQTRDSLKLNAKTLISSKDKAKK